MDDKPARPLTPKQKRFLDQVERIRANQPTAEDLAYMARELVQVTLPHRNPGDVPEWARKNGNLTLSIRPGWTTDQKTGQRQSIGYPYGNIPRLLLFWLTAEAVRTRSRTIELGNSLSDFMFQLGLNTDNGSLGAKRSDARRLRKQMDRLFRATISFDRAMVEDGRVGNTWLDMQVTSGGEVWWSPRDPSQAALWGSWIELGDKFFRAIIAAPVPLDMRALKALKQSPLALDLYSWLTYEAYRAYKSGKGRFVAWKLLAEQMGADYANTDEFARKGRDALRKIQTLYPALKLGQMRGGIRVEPESLPAITPQPTPTGEQITPADLVLATPPEILMEEDLSDYLDDEYPDEPPPIGRSPEPASLPRLFRLIARHSDFAAAVLDMPSLDKILVSAQEVDDQTPGLLRVKTAARRLVQEAEPLYRDFAIVKFEHVPAEATISREEWDELRQCVQQAYEKASALEHRLNALHRKTTAVKSTPDHSRE